MKIKELTTDHTELHGFLQSLAPNPLKGAYSPNLFSPPSGGMGGEFNGVFQGVIFIILQKLCNYIVITLFNSVKILLTPCDSVVKKNHYENRKII
jgi:hypothetical protein